ncbi:MAG: type II toxin-antitoxin system VapC family toxin [Propionibacteriaceae bacterium]|nr:type II toxin-antitoxin system VapC family toxin [Propionibacteriaceae bacterium]
MILLDTNVCIALLKGTSAPASERLMATGPDDVRIPSVAAAELLFGARKSGSAKALTATRAFVTTIGVAPFDGAAAEHYGIIRNTLQSAGEIIGPNDLLIAATALSLGATLATGNTREFSRVPGLVIENWIARTSSGDAGSSPA